MSLRSWAPWHTRILAKIALSWLPAANAFWHRPTLFSHRAMDDPSYALNVFALHFDRAPFARKRGPFVALELGPGDSDLPTPPGALAPEFRALDQSDLHVFAFDAILRPNPMAGAGW